jgi:hypothetical protein
MRECGSFSLAGSFIAADVPSFGDGLLVLKWAFKKLPKSIPEALKKDLGPWLD